MTIHPPERGRNNKAPVNVPSTIISTPMPNEKANNTVVPNRTFPAIQRRRELHREPEPLQKQLSGNVEYLYAHDCPYDGRIFTHIILRDNDHIVSILIDKSGNIPAMAQNLGDSIVLEKPNGLQVAGFQKGDQAFFVISDLPETDNLNIARTISDVWNPVA